MTITRRTVSLSLLATLSACGGGVLAPRRRSPAHGRCRIRRSTPGWRRSGRARRPPASRRRHSTGRSATSGYLPGRDREGPQPDGIHPHAGGLPRYRRLRRAGRAWAVAMLPAYGPTLAADRGALRRRAAGRRRHLGAGEQVRHAPRRHPGGLGAVDARLRRAGAAASSNSSSSRRSGSCSRATSRRERMTGSWAGAMGHTQFIPTSYQAYRGRFHRRRAARHLVGRPDRRAGLDRVLPRPLRLATGPALGHRSAPACGFNTAPRRARQRPQRGHLGGDGRERHGRPAGAGLRHRRHPDAAGAARAGLHHLPQLQRDPALQQRRELRARRRPSFRPDLGRPRRCKPASRPTPVA